MRTGTLPDGWAAGADAGPKASRPVEPEPRRSAPSLAPGEYGPPAPDDIEPEPQPPALARAPSPAATREEDGESRSTAVWDDRPWVGPAILSSIPGELRTDTEVAPASAEASTPTDLARPHEGGSASDVVDALPDVETEPGAETTGEGEAAPDARATAGRAWRSEGEPPTGEAPDEPSTGEGAALAETSTESTATAAESLFADASTRVPDEDLVPERISLDELQARVRRQRTGQPPARDGSEADGAAGRRRAVVLAAAAVAVVALLALAVIGTRSNWFAPVTGRVHTGEEIDRARSDAFERGRRAGIGEGVEQGRVQGCRSVFDRAGSSTLMSGPGPRASIVRRHDCDPPS